MTYELALPTDTADLARFTADRLGSRKTLILRAWHAIDPRCVVCETVTAYDGPKGDRPVVGHFVPASVITPGVQGKARGGYRADNVALMCDDCNDIIGDDTVSRIAFRPAYFGTFPSVSRTGAGRDVSDAKRAAVAAATA